MKQLVLALSALIGVTAQAQFNFALKVKTTLPEGTEVSLRVPDSYAPFSRVKVESGQLEFAGMLSEPQVILISVGDLTYPILIDQAWVSAELDKALSLKAASHSSIEFAKFYSAFEGYQITSQDINEYSVAESSEDRARLESINQVFKTKEERRKGMAIDFITNHPDNYASAYLMRFFVLGLETESKIKELYFGLADPVKSTKWGEFVYEMGIRLPSLTCVGCVIPDFSYLDFNGEANNVHALRGSYVLIDFWASWCKPCRIESPVIKQLHEVYRGAGLKILAISMDYSKASWLKAIEKDGLHSWIHGSSDFKGLESQLAKQLGICSLPSNLLIDPSGKIIGKNLHGEQLKLTLLKYMN